GVRARVRFCARTRSVRPAGPRPRRGTGGDRRHGSALTLLFARPTFRAAMASPPAVPPSSLSLYNTLTRKSEPFVPLAPPRVTLYTCGPTVWNYAHIGNFRTFLFEDLLRRYLEYSGFEVFHIMNLTDVDDRTIKAAAAAGKRLDEYTAPFIDAFFADRDYLRLKPAHAYPRATQA